MDPDIIPALLIAGVIILCFIGFLFMVIANDKARARKEVSTTSERPALTTEPEAHSSKAEPAIQPPPITPQFAPSFVPPTPLITPQFAPPVTPPFTPHYAPALRMTGTYPTLRFIVALLRFVGWLFAILGVLGITLIIFIFTVAFSQHAPLLSGLTVPFIAPFAIATLVLGLLCIAFGELIRVFIDIALSTKAILDIAQRAAIKLTY